MNHPDFIQQKVLPYQKTDYRYIWNKGYIVWRTGTGDNVELLHIRTFEKGRGYGRELVYCMLEQLKRNPPYHSVFGFTLSTNEEAQAFYGALGFNLQPVGDLYKGGEACLFWQRFDTLLESKERYESSIHSQT